MIKYLQSSYCDYEITATAIYYIFYLTWCQQLLCVISDEII